MLKLGMSTGRPRVVRLLLEARENIDVGDSKEYESARLIWAAINGYAEVVKLLLTVQAKVEGKDNRDTNWTPPKWAAKHGHEGVVKLLQRQ